MVDIHRDIYQGILYGINGIILYDIPSMNQIEWELSEMELLRKERKSELQAWHRQRRKLTPH